PVHDRLRRSTGPIAVRRLAAGPLVAALEARWTQGRQYAARLVVVLHADSPIIRCILHLDNGATDHRLRARLPTALSGVPARTGADRAGHRAGVGGGPGARRPDHRALGGRVSSGARALAAGRRATGDPGRRDRPRRDGTHSVSAQAGAERLGVRAALLQRDGP